MAKNLLGRSSTQSEYFSEWYEADVLRLRKFSDRETGFGDRSIDGEQYCLMPGLYVLTGMPAVGKSTFAWQLLCNLAARNETCIFVSYEMKMSQMHSKSIARELRRRNIRDGKGITPTSQQIQLGCYWDNPEFIAVKDKVSPRVYDEPDNDIDKLVAGLRAEIAQSKLEIPPSIVIDYLQVLTTKTKKASARERVDECVWKIKKFQKDTDTTVFLISSLGRAGYNADANDMAVFKESGGIEFTADVAWRLIGEKSEGGQPRYVVLSCVKNRFGHLYKCAFEYWAQSDYFRPCELRPEDKSDKSGSDENDKPKRKSR